MQEKTTYEVTFEEILSQLKDRHISRTDKKQINESIKFYYSQKEFYASSKWHDYAKNLKAIIEQSREDIDNRMELSESELWTPFNI